MLDVDRMAVEGALAQLLQRRLSLADTIQRRRMRGLYPGGVIGNRQRTRDHLAQTGDVTAQADQAQTLSVGDDAIDPCVTIAHRVAFHASAIRLT